MAEEEFDMALSTLLDQDDPLARKTAMDTALQILTNVLRQPFNEKVSPAHECISICPTTLDLMQTPSSHTSCCCYWVSASSNQNTYATSVSHHFNFRLTPLPIAIMYNINKKVRRIKTSNAAFQTKIAACRGGVELLTSAGFAFVADEGAETFLAIVDPPLPMVPLRARVVYHRLRQTVAHMQEM